MLIYLHFLDEYYLRMSIIGAKVAAFGARIRIKCVIVGAIRPILMGVKMVAGFTSHPIKISGAE